MTTGLKGSIPRGGTVQALALLALAFLVQAAYLAESRDEPTFGRPVVDAATYDGMAREIAAGTFSLNTPYYQPPLFPYFLALLYRASGNSMLAAKIALALIGALTVMFTALTARRLGGPGPAWAAGLMAAGCGPLIFFNAQLLPAGLAAMLNILFLWLLLGAGAPGAPARCLAAGAAAGLAAITVPNILLFVPFALAWIFRAGVGRGRAARAALLLLLGLAAAILPVTLANYRNSRQVCLISFNGGLNFFIGNNPEADKTIAIRPGFGWENLDKLPMRNRAFTATAQSRFYVARALEYAREHPGHFARGLLKKARQVTNARELPRNVDLYMFRKWSAILTAAVWRAGPFGFPFGILFPLACLGACVAVRERSPAAWLALYAGIYAGSIALFFVAARYRVVLLPAMIVLAALAIGWLWEHRRQGRRLAVAAAVLLAAGAWTNSPVSAPTDGYPFAAEAYNFLAIGALRENEFARAGRDVGIALALAPGYAEAHHTRGLLAMRQGRAADARGDFLKAVALKPDYAEAWHSLGLAEEKLGDWAQAEAAHRQAVRHGPEISSLARDLGALLFRRGRTGEAVPLLRRAVELDIANYEAHGLLAWIRATSPDAAFRDGAQAVRTASFLIRAQGESNPMWFSVLAAGQAEVGNFEQAAAAQELAIRLWRRAGREDAAQDGERQLALYRQGLPLRDQATP